MLTVAGNTYYYLMKKVNRPSKIRGAISKEIARTINRVGVRLKKLLKL